MKVSDLILPEIARYIREEEEFLDETDKLQLEAMRKAAVEYVKSYTGLTEQELDEHEDITIAVLVLISDMYDNRQMQSEKSGTNRVVDTILSMYQVNLL